MSFYSGAMFPELKGKLLVAMHGFRDSGHRIVAYTVDAQGKPVLNKTGDQRKVVPLGIVTGWTRVPGVRPMGRPLGITQATDGALWFLDDKARTIMVLLRDRGGRASTDDEPPLTGVSGSSTPAPEGWAALYRAVLLPRCQSCHEELRDGDPQAAWRRLAAKGMVDPQHPRASAVLQRMLGEGAGNPMPMPTGLHKFPEDYAAVKTFVETLPQR